MSEMIERVARSMFEECLRREPTKGASWDACYPDQQDALRILARVAIEATAEYLSGDLPDAVEEAYADEEFNDHPTELYFSPRRFTAMIQAALKDPTT